MDPVHELKIRAEVLHSRLAAGYGVTGVDSDEGPAGGVAGPSVWSVLAAFAAGVNR